MALNEEDRQNIADENVNRLRSGLDNMMPRNASISAVQNDDGSVDVYVMANPNNPLSTGEAGALKLRESIAGGVAEGLGVSGPESANDSSQTRIHIPAEKVQYSIDIIQENLLARYNATTTFKQRGINEYDPLPKDPTSRLDDLIKEATNVGLGMAPSDPDKRREFYASESREAQERLQKSKDAITAIREDLYTKYKTSMGMIPENGKSAEREELFKRDLAKLGKLNNDGSIAWEKVDPKDTDAAVRRKTMGYTDSDRLYLANMQARASVGTSVAVAPPAPPRETPAPVVPQTPQAPIVANGSEPANRGNATATRDNPAPSPNAVDNPDVRRELANSQVRQNPARAGGIEGLLETLMELLSSLISDTKGLNNAPQLAQTFPAGPGGNMGRPASTPVLGTGGNTLQI